MAEIRDEDDTAIDILPEALEDDPKNKLSISVWKVMQWNRPEISYIIIGSISSIVMGSAMPVFGLVFGEVIEVLFHPDSDYVREQTNLFSLYFVIAGIVSGAATFLQIWTYGIAGEYLTERIRGNAFKAMIRQEIGWFDDKSNGTGTLCSRLSSDAAAVQGVISSITLKVVL